MSGRTHSLTAIVILGIGLSPLWGQSIWRVDAAAGGGQNNGTSWTDAFVDLQDALENAVSGDEIWVAEGVYKPDRGTGDRTMAFVLPCGVSLYGGFAGDEECLDQRDLHTYETILNGDLQGDDGPPGCDQFSTCCVEHDGPGCDDPLCESIVCGFNPQCCEDGYYGSGWSDSLCSLIASKSCCHLSSWRACENTQFIVKAIGCGLNTTLDGFTVTGAYFDLQREGYSGFTDNAAIYIDSGSLLVRNCNINSNHVWGIYALRAHTVHLADSTFRDAWPGGSMQLHTDQAVIEGCQFLDQARAVSVYAKRGIQSRLRDCTFTGRVSTYVQGDWTIEKCSFIGSNGLIVSDGRHLVGNCSFVGTKDHLRLHPGASIVADNSFFAGSVFDTISGSNRGLFRNCTIVNNSSRDPAIGWGFGRVTILNCTIAGNAQEPSNPLSGGIHLYASSAQVLNSIAWDNGDNPSMSREENQIGVTNGSNLEINFSIVEGWTGKLGGDNSTGNSGVDPIFIDPDGPDDIPGTDDDDFRLAPGSPAISAGDPTFAPAPGETDLDGHARVLCGAVDIGAYESGFGDGDCDGVINAWDFAVWVACAEGELQGQVCETMDSDADGDVDLKDFAAIQRLDR